jgi:hypothetical protein
MPDPSQVKYPLIYRPNLKWRRLLLALAAIAGIGGPVDFLTYMTGVSAWLLSMVAVAVGAGIVAALLRWRIVLRADSIEVYGLTRARMIIDRGAITGCRTYPAVYAPQGHLSDSSSIHLMVSGRDTPGVTIERVEECFDPDDAFWEWMRTLPSGNTGDPT